MPDLDADVLALQPLLWHLASQALRGRTSLEREDLVQDGNVALLQLRDRFDPDRSAFRTIGSHRAYGAMLDAIRTRQHGRTDRRFLSTVAAATEHLTRVLQREPDRAEVAAQLGLPIAELDQRLVRGQAVMHFVASDDLGEARTIPVRTPSPLTHVLQREAAHALSRALATLPVEQAAVLRAKYVEDLSERQIAHQSGLSVSGVQYRARIALQTVRAALAVPVHARVLKPARTVRIARPVRVPRPPSTQPPQRARVRAALISGDWIGPKALALITQMSVPCVRAQIHELRTDGCRIEWRRNPRTWGERSEYRLCVMAKER